MDETIQFQLGFPSGAVASCLSTYSMNFLDRFFLDGEKGFAELVHPHIAHQAIQMEEMAGIILAGKQPVLPVDGEEAVKDLIIIDAIYQAARTGNRIALQF